MRVGWATGAVKSESGGMVKNRVEAAIEEAARKKGRRGRWGGPRAQETGQWAGGM